MSALNLKMILEAVDKITAPVRNITTKIRTMMKTAVVAVGELADRMDKIGKKAAEIGGFLTARLTLPIVGMGALSIRSAGQVEELSMQLEHLAGGADEARKYVHSLQKYIDQFGLADVGDSVKALETAGYTIDEINGRMATLSNLAAGSKAPLAALTEQYIDLRKAGKVSDGDLSTMMKANIPIVQELAKQLGKTDKQIWNMAANGQISFKQYRHAIEGLTSEGGRFGDAMEKRGRSINGVFTAMKNSLGGVMAELGDSLWADLKSADKIKAITEAVRGAVKWFLTLPTGMKSFVTWTVLIIAAVGPLILIVGQLIVGLAGLMLVWSKVALVFGGILGPIAAVYKGLKWLLLGAGRVVMMLPTLIAGVRALGLAFISNPIGLFITAVVALGAAAYLLIKHWDKVKAFFTTLWEVLKGAFKEGVDSVLSYLQPLIDAVNQVIGGLSQIGQSVGKKLSGAWEHLTGDDAGASDMGTAPGGVVAAPVRAGGKNKVDAGGTIKIEIAQDGKARVAQAQTNDSRMQFRAADTGALMGAR